MIRPALLAAASIGAAFLLAWSSTRPAGAAEPVPAGVPIVAMCAPDEPGERLEFFGQVLDENGRPLPRASIIAYNTDAAGLYNPPGSPNRNPRICGVAVTDDDGWYRFSTIRPGAYPNAQDPAHIHLHIDAAVHQHTYVTFWFEGDPLITPAKRRSLDRETVIVTLHRSDAGAWTFRHDIRLRGS